MWRRLKQRTGARSEERISAPMVAVLGADAVWDLDSGCMTRTFKLKRDVIAKRHEKEIAALFSRGR
jgi:long-subunit acyl-CoA synthetase (AMP-forming)